MSIHGNRAIALIMLGAGPRLAVALLVVVAVWLGFVWATEPVGAP